MRRIAPIEWLLLAGLSAGLAAQEEPRKLTIEQAVAEAVRNNLLLMAERVNISLAEARIVTARLRPNPVFSAGGDHLDWIGSRFTEENGGGPTELNFRTDWLLERPGKRRARVETAGHGRSAAEYQFLDAVRTLVVETQNIFVDAQLARDTLVLARQNLANLNRIVEINETRLRAGDISKVELIRSRLAALQYQNSVRQAELRLRNALIRLAETLGRRDPASVEEVVGDLRIGDPALSPAALLEAALEARPDLRALRSEVERAAAEVRLQSAEARPDFTLGTEFRRQQGVNGKGNSIGLFLEVPVPLLNRNQGEIERARHEQQRAQLRLRARQRAVAAEVETALQQYRTARELLAEIEGTMISQARDVREITEYAYKQGDATLLELLDAQRAFNETMQSYNESRAEYARSLYLLDAIAGKAVQP